MTFEVFIMTVGALLSVAIFLLYRMITNDQRHYLSAFNNINAALNSCMDAIDSYGDVIEGVVIPLKDKLDAEEATNSDVVDESNEYENYEINMSDSWDLDFGYFSIGDVVHAISCVNIPKHGEEHPTFEDGSPIHPLTWPKWITVAGGHALKIQDLHGDRINPQDPIKYTCAVLDANGNDTSKTIYVYGKENIFIDYDTAVRHLEYRNNRLQAANEGGWDTLIYDHEGNTDENREV